MYGGIWAVDGGKKEQSDGTQNRNECDFVAELSGQCQSSSSSQEDLIRLERTDS